MCVRGCGSEASADHPALGLAASKVSTASVAAPAGFAPMYITFVVPDAGPAGGDAPSPLPCFILGLG